LLALATHSAATLVEHLCRILPAQKRKAAYQDFFALWKDADPDIPILKQAKVEYTKLK
jgi:hypothetical protein